MKLGGRKISNLRYAGGTTLLTENIEIEGDPAKDQTDLKINKAKT